MRNYAFLNDNNIVTQVIDGPDAFEIIEGITNWVVHYEEAFGATCILFDPETHKNHPAPGYLFDAENNVFIPPKPLESWVLNEETFQWENPIPMPTEGGPWMWVEANLAWEEIPEE
jgi:hypothetical protein